MINSKAILDNLEKIKDEKINEVKNYCNIVILTISLLKTLKENSIAI